jgi:AcrR family transcriptional regulator
MPDTYHHRDLSSTLRAATAELVAERGPRGFSLREVARRAGVSHAAPAHHFGDSRGLLTAVAAEGFQALADSLTAAVADHTDARERLRASGRAYVATAIANPGHYAVMIDSSIHDPDDPRLAAEGLRAFAQLIAVVEAIRDDCNPDLDIDAAATTCWATMHGLVVLDPKMAKIAEKFGRRPVDIFDHFDSAVDLLFNGFTRSRATPDLADG